jgi:hypothetical protein
MSNTEHGLPIGTNIIIRTVTHYYTGLLLGVADGFLHLGNAAWIADTGRWEEALRTGQLSEVEPYPDDCWVSAGAVVDFSPWGFELPRTVK